jgi:hypothetical protein
MIDRAPFGKRLTNIGPPMTLGNAAAALVRLLVLYLMLALSGCSTRAIDIICPPAGVCPNTRSGHGGGQ